MQHKHPHHVVVMKVDLDEFVVDLVQFVPVVEEYDAQAEVIVVRIAILEHCVVRLVDLVVESGDQSMVDFGVLEVVVSGDREVARDDPEGVMAGRMVSVALEVGSENLEVVDYLEKVAVEQKFDLEELDIVIRSIVVVEDH
jgi:hypothetical protein